MKTFDEALEEETKRHRTDLDSQGCSDREKLRYLSWFREGAHWAENSPELINEILTKYHEWAINTPSKTFKKWEDEEGDFDKTKARIRKEFNEYLNNSK